MNTQKLLYTQFNRKMLNWQQARRYFQPEQGWVRTLRKILGITISDFAKKLQVDRSRIIKIEADELADKLTLRTLRKAAETLNCDLIYAFVPKKPPQEILQEQAHKLAKKMLERTAHHMKLENQEVSSEQQQEMLDNLVEQLLKKSPKNLWKEE